MAVFRNNNDNYQFDIWGSDTLVAPWRAVWGSNGYVNEHWTLATRPVPLPANVGYVDMSLSTAVPYIDTTTAKTTTDATTGITTTEMVIDTRSQDWLTLDNVGVSGAPWVLNVVGVEYMDAPLIETVDLEIIGTEGITTNGSYHSITMHVGDQVMVYTGATRDSSLFMGTGYDTVNLSDNLDIPGTQYWSLIRQVDGSLDAYNLFSGYRVRLEGGYQGWTAMESTLVNYGEIERLNLDVYDTTHKPVSKPDYYPGVDLPKAGDRGNQTNIDLRSYEWSGTAYVNTPKSNSFNLAAFNFIRYTSDNVWVGEATIYQEAISPSTTPHYSIPGSQQVTGAVSLDVVDTSRNGSHDLIVAEQTTAIDGYFRLYSINVASAMFNEFNRVYLGTSAAEAVSKTATLSADSTVVADRVALYGFGGNDTLTAGAGSDYLFGGQSTYSKLDAAKTGNVVAGGDGADYFGVGATDSAGVYTAMPSTVVDGQTQGYATDVITDWDSVNDTVVVLPNGVAVIAGLYGVTGMTRNNTIDLVAHTAVATSDQNASGARGNVLWDGPVTVTGGQTLDYIFLHQTDRDTLSIVNQADVNVVNAGLIVARGLLGDDTLHGSTGADYLYGNGGNNRLDLGVDSVADRAYVDQFSGQQFVHNFVLGVDDLYLNKDVITAYRSSLGVGAGTYASPDVSDATVRASLTAGQRTSYASGVYDGNVPAFDPVYEPWWQLYSALLKSMYATSNGAYTNDEYRSVEAISRISVGVVGAGQVAGGLALMTSIWGIVPGAILVALGGLNIDASINAVTHLNATYDGPKLDHYVNLMTAGKAVISSVSADNEQIGFLDFFELPNDALFSNGLEVTKDGPLLNYGSGNSIFTYAALHTNCETFVYLISSKDNIIQADETRKVAEINGLLNTDDLVAYLGSTDIYNNGSADVVVPVFGPVATFTLAMDPLLTVADHTRDSTIVLAISFEVAPVAGDRIKVYAGSTLLTTITATAETTYSYTDDLTALARSVYPAAGFEFSLAYRVVTETALGLTTNSDIQTIVIDHKAPAITSASAIDTGPSILTDSVGVVYLDAGSGNHDFEVTVAQTDIDKGKTAALLVAAQSTTKTYAIYTADALGNVSAPYADTSVVLGTSSADTIVGSSVANIIYGFGGADSLTGSSGSDSIFGGGGADTITGGLGADLIDMGAAEEGNWLVLASGSGFDFVANFGGGDKDKIQIAGYTNRDTDSTTLLLQTAATGANAAIATATTELLYVTGATVHAKTEQADIASALGSAFNMTTLSNGKVIFSVTDGKDCWVGLYNQAGSDNVVAAADIEVLAKLVGAVTVDDDNFWLPKHVAPDHPAVLEAMFPTNNQSNVSYTTTGTGGHLGSTISLKISDPDGIASVTVTTFKHQYLPNVDSTDWVDVPAVGTLGAQVMGYTPLIPFVPGVIPATGQDYWVYIVDDSFTVQSAHSTPDNQLIYDVTVVDLLGYSKTFSGSWGWDTA